MCLLTLVVDSLSCFVISGSLRSLCWVAFQGKGRGSVFWEWKNSDWLSPCLLCHLLPAVSGSGFSLRLLTLHSVGRAWALESHSLSSASTWGCLCSFAPECTRGFLSCLSGESLRSYFMQDPAIFIPCTTRESPKWPFCGGFISAGPLWWLGVVSRLISFESSAPYCRCIWHRERLVKCCWCELPISVV